MKKLTLRSLRFTATGLCLALGLLANHASAQNQYFTTVAANGSYSWDAANWNANPASGNTGPYTFNWVAGNFARFYNGPGSGSSFTVTVNASEANTGVYDNAGSGSTMNINDAGSGTGNLNVQTAIQGYLAASGTTLNINVPIVGNGGIAPESTGSIYLNAANTYTAGTDLGDSGNTLVYFNNNNAFGPSRITLNRTGIANFSTLLSTGGSTITLANSFLINSAVGTGTALNFASSANTPVVSSGTWTLGTYSLNLRNAGGSTAPLTISGAISGSSILALSANGTGSKTILSGANPFAGQIIVTGSGGTYGGNSAIRLTLGAANAIASSSSVMMSGGTLDPGGFHQAMSSATLSLTASSTIDYTSGQAEMDLANSSAVAWTPAMTLNLVATGGGNWNNSGDLLRIGTDATGLTVAQLGEIEFNGTDLGDAAINAQGFVYDLNQIPEPSMVVLGLLGGLGVLAVRRRTA